VQDVHLELLGAQQVKGLGGVERGAVPRILAQPAVDFHPFDRAVVRARRLLLIGDLACAVQQHDCRSFSLAHCLAYVPSVARDISALPASISRAEMHRTAILVLRLALSTQIAI